MKIHKINVIKCSGKDWWYNNEIGKTFLVKKVSLHHDKEVEYEVVRFNKTEQRYIPIGNYFVYGDVIQDRGMKLKRILNEKI